MIGKKMGTIDTNRIDSYTGQTSPLSIAAGFVSKMIGVFGTFGQRFDEALARRQSRRTLMSLTDHELKDIGISRYDAFREGNRPFWE
jgi:uncharacterized protein YjiS (DUF1127 family)